MNRRGIQLFEALIIFVALVATGCGSPSIPTSQPVSPSGTSGQERPVDIGTGDWDMAGLWRGFWSPKGCARTERYLFLADGRWGWITLSDDTESASTGTVQRSGSWEIRGQTLVLQELQRKEFLGCQGDSTEKTGDRGRAGPTCDNPRYRTIHHESPIVKELSLGECPPNLEAEKLDTSYLCRSIGGQAFWRHETPGLSEQAAFFSK